MTKLDKSIHNICIASIKRSTMKPYDFKWTKFYESNSDFLNTGLQINLREGERFICSTIIDADNYSILTTKQLTTKQDGQITSGDLEGATDKDYGNFKGTEDKSLTFGQVQLKNGIDLKYFIETGKASMIMIHGVRTLIRTQQMTSTQVDNVTRVWNRKDGD
jgi:hypothetical protein